MWLQGFEYEGREKTLSTEPENLTINWETKSVARTTRGAEVLIGNSGSAGARCGTAGTRQGKNWAQTTRLEGNARASLWPEGQRGNSGEIRNVVNRVLDVPGIVRSLL